MRNIKVIAVILSLLPVTTQVAANNLKMGTGGSTGNYIAMGKDINNYCAEQVSQPLAVLESMGSVDNLLGMLNKKFDLGIVQEDVLNFNAQRSPSKVNRNRIKILTGLHEEAVHLLIPKGYNPNAKKQTAWTDLFSNNNNDAPKKFQLSMLKNQRVGSTGGAIISAEALSYFFDLQLHVYETPLAVNNTSTPIVLVGGAPYAPVKSYLDTGKWMLATLDYKAIAETAPFYSNQTVNYRIDGKMQSISTVGVRALLVGKSFRKDSRNAPMTELATCVYDNIADLADDPDTNPNWSSVYDYIDDGGQSDWSYFPLAQE